jgi:hypothetical protein
MTEAEWLACDNPGRMLDFLQRGSPELRAEHRRLRIAWQTSGRWLGGRSYEGKLWRFLAACVPMLFRRVQCAGCRDQLVFFDKLAEQPDDREATERLKEAGAPLWRNPSACRQRCGLWQVYRFTGHLLDEHIICIELWNTMIDLSQADGAECAAAVRSFHDVFGNPFRPVVVDPPWLTWNDAAVRKLAQFIYDERRFADLPILADALEDAGCSDADILAHCRGGGEHVRGCWVVDLLLGKS